MSRFVPILAILYGLGFANLFLRSSLGVLAPDLAREMAMEPAALSLVASAFFLAYAIMQVPTGMLLDRYGARRTLAAMLVFTTAGTALFAAGRSVETLVAARLLMGLGCAGVFTGAFYVMAQWLAPDRVVTQAGALNSFAALGTLCATTPLAILIGEVGWRTSYWAFVLAVAALTLLVALCLRDAPSGARAPTQETLAETFAGVHAALAQPGMPRLLVTGLPLSAASTLTGVWGAPYLKDVHGLDGIGRGNVLLAMAACAMAGHFLYGQAARRFNTVKGVVLAGGTVVLAATLLLAAVPRLPTALVAGLFCLITFAASYPTTTYAHARGLVPPHLVGRGVSLINMGIMMAIAVMQLVFGWIVGVFVVGAEVPPEHAYRAGFAAQAAVALLAIVVYAPIRDVRPRG
jgi:MFS family permease